MIRQVLILGGGSAGLIAAISLRKMLPALAVRLVRSSEIGVIGVGEGTTNSMPGFLFDFLKLSRGRFYAQAEPTWKLGIRFLWGPRDYFDYPFAFQLSGKWSHYARPSGYYAEEDFHGIGLGSALMEAGKAFPRNSSGGGGPDMRVPFGFHIENAKFVETLESIAEELGVTFVEGKVSDTERGPKGIEALRLEDGQRLVADLFVDCSGFRSELLGRALGEEYVDYGRSLFCDRAVIGGWKRTTEPVLPYTVAETMDAGWAWQIEHEHHINRGYVYSSQAISDDAACEEFLRKNPKAPPSPRVVKFRSGRYRRVWVENVVAIGNSAGFVEPLEATALMTVTRQCRNLLLLLEDADLRPTETIRNLYNQLSNETFDDTRDFLALHYKCNTRSDTEFWRHCRSDTEMGALGPLLDFFHENGPSSLASLVLPSQDRNVFGLEGYLAILVGNRAPYQAKYGLTDGERVIWNEMRRTFRHEAEQGLSVSESLGVIRSPLWHWKSDVS